MSNKLAVVILEKSKLFFYFEHFSWEWSSVLFTLFVRHIRRQIFSITNELSIYATKCQRHRMCNDFFQIEASIKADFRAMKFVDGLMR